MIFIPPNIKNILVNHSSGMDSTLLIYNLLQKLQDLNKLPDVNFFINTGYDAEADPNAVQRSDRICKVIFDKFNVTYTRLQFEYQDGPNKIPTFSRVNSEFKKKYDIDAYYRGTSLGPPREIQEKYNYHKPERDLGGLQHVEKHSRELTQIYSIIPWYNKDKKYIVDEWKKSSFLMNEVYNLTFSCVCTGDKTDNWTKHCYEMPGTKDRPNKWCWWCIEKKWAFGELDG